MITYMNNENKLDSKLVEQFLKDVQGQDVEWVVAYLKTKIRDLGPNPQNPTYGFYDSLYQDVDQQFRDGNTGPIPDWYNLMSGS